MKTYHIRFIHKDWMTTTTTEEVGLNPLQALHFAAKRLEFNFYDNIIGFEVREKIINESTNSDQQPPLIEPSDFKD